MPWLADVEAVSVFLTCPGWKGHSRSYVLPIPHLSTISCPVEIFHFVRWTQFITILSEISANSSRKNKSPSKMKKKHLGVQQLWSHRHQTKLKMVSHERSPPTNSFLWRLHCGKNTPWRPHMILTKNWCWEEFLGCKSELLKFNQHATCTAIAEAKMNGFQLFNAFQFSPGGRLTWWWR